MTRLQTYTIGDVARMAGTTVRALRHWDAIGLLTPAMRATNGYRRYDADDLLRLQQIGMLRRFGLGLAEIAAALNAPSENRRATLLTQRTALLQRQSDTAKLLAALDAALLALDGEEIDMTSLFEGFNPDDFAAEAQEKWGETEAWKTSQRRTKAYTAADWARIKATQDAIYRAIADAMAAGIAPESAEGRALATRHRQQIDADFYPCSPEMHANLAQMYDSDDRFRATMDSYAPGLTDWLIAAIRA